MGDWFLVASRTGTSRDLHHHRFARVMPPQQAGNYSPRARPAHGMLLPGPQQKVGGNYTSMGEFGSMKASLLLI